MSGCGRGCRGTLSLTTNKRFRKQQRGCVLRYYANEDKGDNAATIHDVESPTAQPSCFPQKKNPENGEWWPCATLDEAFAKARETGRANVVPCCNCKPEQPI